MSIEELYRNRSWLRAAHNRLRIAKNREEERAEAAPSKTRARACPRSVLGATDGGSPTFSLYGCFWRHLLAAKGGKNRSSQEHANRRFGNSPTFLRKHSFLYFRLDPQVHDRARFLASAEVASSLCENVRRGGDVRFGERWKQHRRCNGNCSACAMAWRCLRTVRRI